MIYFPTGYFTVPDRFLLSEAVVDHRRYVNALCEPEATYDETKPQNNDFRRKAKRRGFTGYHGGK